MTHKTPDFWYPKNGAQPSLFLRLLALPAWFYRQGFKAHQASKQAQKVSVPVLCVGNLVAGGTGKTPTAIACYDLIIKQKLAKAPYFLLRGYGGAERGPLVVDPDTHSAWDVGDEAMILTRYGPTIVSVDRAAGAELAIEQGADLVIMDDGLQNPGIHKDIKMIVINGDMGFGNGRVMPAGPLREPLDSGLAKGDVFLMIGEDRAGAMELLPEGVPVLRAGLKTAAKHVPDQSKSYIAFAGLGYPDKFFKYLREDVGLTIIEEIAYSDHYPYEQDDLRELQAKAKVRGAELITTVKDYMRLPEHKDQSIHALPVSLVLDKPKDMVKLIKDTLA